MPSRVSLKVTKGSLDGKEFQYSAKEALILGRQKDCGIVLPENTVSRYHCMIEINPPEVTVRDFGSLNGTFLNGEKIGQREKDMLAEDARKEIFNEFSLKQGDTLRLGRDCEISIIVYTPEYCGDCYCEIAEAERAKFTDNGIMLCRACYLHRCEQANDNRGIDHKRGHQEEKQSLPDKREKCVICGSAFSPGEKEDRVCGSCRADPIKMLEFMLMQALNNDADVRGIRGYKRVKLLGRGGMGEVWLVEEEKTKKRMALKLMLPKYASDKRARAMFLREAANAGQLKYKNVVRQYDSGCSEGVFFILMELCGGGSVDDLMKRSKRKLSVNLATEIMLQVLDGLEYAHHAKIESKLENGQTKWVQGLVHRDFKPANIFLSDVSGHPIAKVADFGLAKCFETAGLTGMTRTGTAGGTPVFMPRQQILNYKYAKPEVDVWAAAASYYFMLTGTPPKEAKGKDIWMAMLSERAVPILKRNAAIPPRLAEVIDEALVDQPDIRIRSAAEFKQMIERAVR